MMERQTIWLPDSLLRKIEERRGELTPEEFIEHCVDTFLAQQISEKQATRRAKPVGEQVTREELEEFERRLKQTMRAFLEFLLTYNIELTE